MNNIHMLQYRVQITAFWGADTNWDVLSILETENSSVFIQINFQTRFVSIRSICDDSLDLSVQYWIEAAFGYMKEYTEGNGGREINSAASFQWVLTPFSTCTHLLFIHL